MSRAKLILPLLLSLSIMHTTSALDNGLALKPPMGWMAWQRFTCQTDCDRHPDDCIGERLFQQTAHQLQEQGFSAAGYQYVSIDDCWSDLRRDAHSRLRANATRFPSGLGALAARLHQLGLKLGLYGNCGTSTCAGYPAQLRPDNRSGAGFDPQAANYFQLDAHSLARWQVDAFKLDGCHIDPRHAPLVCPHFAAALAASNRPILLTCEWPFYLMYAHEPPDFELAARSCNLWRYYDDIEDSWQSILNTIDYTVKHQSTIVKYHGPSHWFDPDQLVVGNFGLSHEQSRAQMAVWCMWSAPLIMGNDLRKLRQAHKQILLNERLIAIDQDPMGVLALMVRESDGVQVFVKPIEPIQANCPSFAILYLNRRTLGSKRKVSFKLRDLLIGAPIYEAAKRQPDVQARNCFQRLFGSPEELEVGVAQSQPVPQVYYKLEDLFSGQQVGALALDMELELEVAPSGVAGVKLVEFGAVN